MSRTQKRRVKTYMNDDKKWYYVDLTTTSVMRIAVCAGDEAEAKEFAGNLVDGGMVDPTETVDYPYGSFKGSISVGDVETGEPPEGMHKFDCISEEFE